MTPAKKIPDPVIIMDDYDRMDGYCVNCRTTTKHAVRTINKKLISTCMDCHNSEELDPNDIEEIGYFEDNTDYLASSAELIQ